MLVKHPDVSAQTVAERKQLIAKSPKIFSSLLEHSSHPADRNNANFQNTPSHYVSLDQRVKTAFADPFETQRLNAAMSAWCQNNPKVKKWSDMALVRSLTTTLDKIVIDTTLQRNLYAYWVCTILQNFSSLRVMAVQVYEDKDKPGYYVCWDGQHTVIALYIIAVKILKLDPAKIEIPINISPCQHKSEMRLNFLELNGPAKRPVSNAARFRQMVLGCRVDGNTDPEWVRALKIQEALELYKMTSLEEDQAPIDGGLSERSEIDDTASITPEDVRNFAEFFHTLTKSSRPVGKRESWQWMWLFRRCREYNITVDTQFIQNLVQAIHDWFAGTTYQVYSSEALYDIVNSAYLDWYVKVNGYTQFNHWSRKKKHYTLKWLTEMLRVKQGMNMPNIPSDWGPIDPKALDSSSY